MKKHKMPDADLTALVSLLIGVWRRCCKLSGPSDVLQTREFRQVVEAVRQINTDIQAGTPTSEDRYWKEPGFLGAQLFYDWIVHYQQGLALIHEMPTPPRRVLDLASGAGAFACAALRHGATDAVVLDRQPVALKLAAEIIGKYGYALTARRHSVTAFPLPVAGEFDLIIAAHCLPELFPHTRLDWQAAQKNWIQRLLPYLAPEGVLLLVDSSHIEVNHRFLALRNQLVGEGWPIQAPCVWQGACPALQAHSPCYAQRNLEKPYLLKEIQRAAEINLGSLKMTYLMLRHPAAGWPHLPPGRSFYRVISPPVEAHSGKRYHLCGTDGKKDLGSHLAEQPHEARAFDYLKRGELISVEGALVKQQHFDIILGTRVQVEAALNKPIPADPLA